MPIDSLRNLSIRAAALSLAAVVVIALAGTAAALPGSGGGEPAQATARKKTPRQRDPFRSGAAAAFRKLERRLRVDAGVALGAAVRGGRTYRVGHAPPPRSWSTIKAPVAHAVIASYGGIAKIPRHLRNDIHAAITRSDNGAASRLYGALGADRERRVERTLRSGGDELTRMTPGGGWGRTVWTLRRQQKFAAGLRCLPHAAPLMKQMRDIAPDQRWGLGRLSRRPVFKGGWGPEGGYTVRQFGQVKLDAKHVLAVAIYARPDSGSFGDGTRALSEIARWIPRHVIAERLVPPRCRR